MPHLENSPRVTVIIPFKNGELFLPRALKGLDALRFYDLEVILVNDASTDHGPTLVENWIRNTKIKATIIHTGESLGAGRARSLGVNKAQGKFIWFADCDDIWSPDILTHLWNGVTDTDVDIVVCDAERIFASTGKKQKICDAPILETCTGRANLHRLLSGKVQGHLVNKLIKSDLLKSTPFPHIRAHEDLAILLQLFNKARKVSYMPGTQYSYLVREGSTLQSADYDWRNLLEVAIIAEKILDSGNGNAASYQHLRRFKQTHIMLPAARNMAKRRLIVSHEVPYISTIGISDIWRELKQRNFMAVIQLSLLGISPPAFAYAFSVHSKLASSQQR